MDKIRADAKADLHMHSSFSDGTDTPAQLAEKVREAGISVFSVTDHDTADGAEELLAGPLPDGLTVIPGIEFSCRLKEGKCHILGYGYDVHAPAFRAALEEGNALRRDKLRRRLEFLEAEGIRFPDAEVEALWRMRSPGKPHLGNLMVKYGYAKNREQAITGTLNRCPAGMDRIDAKTAIRAILDAGGIPVWAHPLGETGERPLSGEEIEERLAELLSYGLRGMECYYSAYPVSGCRKLAGIAGRNGLLVSGGSDYHGGNKKIALGTLNADGAAVPAERLSVLKNLRK